MYRLRLAAFLAASLFAISSFAVPPDQGAVGHGVGGSPEAEDAGDREDQGLRGEHPDTAGEYGDRQDGAGQGCGEPRSPGVDAAGVDPAGAARVQGQVRPGGCHREPPRGMGEHAGR